MLPRSTLGAGLLVVAALASGTASAVLVSGTATAPRDGAEPRAHEPAEPRASAPWSDAWLLEQGPRYLHDGPARRAALEHALANPDNLYGRMRLASYGRGTQGWDLLPQWNPRSRVLGADDVDALVRGAAPALGEAAPLWDGQQPETMAQWVALGRRVFFEYPLRPEPAAAHALATGEADALGLQRDRDGAVPGLVVFRELDGGDAVGLTCALCHSRVEQGAVVVGRARREFDYGAMRLAWHDGAAVPVDPRLAARMATWGPGRADITEDDDQDPVAIPDLWRMRELRSLTQAATIVHDSPLALAIRQETQLLHANGERVRPPRELAWALAMYLYSLEPPPRASAPPDATIDRGRALFAEHCVECHSDANGSGEPVHVARVGTDPALARGRARGTGRYRPAPLVAVAEAAPYLHDGSIASLEQLLDPTRVAQGPAGHSFGTELSAHDRDALVAWLRTL